MHKNIYYALFGHDRVPSSAFSFPRGSITQLDLGSASSVGAEAPADVVEELRGRASLLTVGFRVIDAGASGRGTK